MPKYVKAESGPYDSVIYYDQDGDQYIVRDGARSLRNNNPGNLVPGKVSQRHNQIGVSGKFAVFPDLLKGKEAMADSLKNTYGDRSLSQMIEKYAPRFENDTDGYLKHLRQRTKVKDEEKIKDFTAIEFTALVDAIIAMEGDKPPILKRVQPGKKEILRVLKDKRGVITHYDVEELGWLKKPEAIAFTRAGEIDAVIAKSKTGSAFLRTRPDITVVNNLDNKE
jgi:hypothetical protein